MTDFDLTPAQSGMLDELLAEPVRALADGSLLAKRQDGELVELTGEGELKPFEGPEQAEEPPPEPPPVPDDLADGGAEEEVVSGEVVTPESPDALKPEEIDLRVDTRSDDISAEVARAMDRNDEVLILDEIQERAITTMVYEFSQGGEKMVDLSVAGVNEVIRLMNERGGCQIGISERPPIVDKTEGEDGKTFYRVMVFSRDARFPESGRWGTAMEPELQRRRQGPDVWDKFALTKALNKAERNALKKHIPEEWRQIIIAQSQGTEALKQLQPTGGGAVAALPPAIEGPEAEAVKAEIHEAYKELRELNRLKMPPARFNAYLTKAETESIDRMVVFRDTILEMVASERTRKEAAS